MMKLLFIARRTPVVDWRDPAGRTVVWSWIVAAAVVGLVSSMAGLLGSGLGAGLGRAILSDNRIGVLVSAIVPAILTWRWCRTAILGTSSTAGRRSSALGRR